LALNSKVLAKLPRAGLGNKLLVWAHAYVFARVHHLVLMEKGWTQISIGPYLRGEKSKRRYLRQIRKAKIYVALNYIHYKKVNVPKSNWMSIELKPDSIYIFHEMPGHTSYFDLLKDHRITISQAFFKKVKGDILNRSRQKTVSFAIHIRLGDFKRFSKNSYDWDWYSKLIQDIRAAIGEVVPVTVYSDGWPEEIAILNDEQSIYYRHSGNDLQDLIEMSGAKILVTYPHSTFSQWAGFIGDSILIHMNKKLIRSSSENKFEGYPFTERGDLRTNLIHDLRTFLQA